VVVRFIVVIVVVVVVVFLDCILSITNSSKKKANVRVAQEPKRRGNGE
jgi:hypothetical protein